LEISRRMHISATLVLPAPVGAQMSRFSSEWSAAGEMRDWIRLRVLKPEKPSRAHFGRSATSMSFWNGVD
jgi:hypothetical protein